MQQLLARSDRAFTTAARQMRIAAFICVLFGALFVLLARRFQHPTTTWLLIPAALVLLIGATLLVLNAKRYESRQSSP